MQAAESHTKGVKNEIRLLPGQKIFHNGVTVDCDIKDCVFEDISGVYTFKLYAQPNIANAERGMHDGSGTVGNIERIVFKDITFAKVSQEGFNALPVKGLFEICADCNDIHIENVRVNNTVEQCNDLDLKLVKVGPLSAVWTNGSYNPEDWGEV